MNLVYSLHERRTGQWDIRCDDVFFAQLEASAHKAKQIIDALNMQVGWFKEAQNWIQNNVRHTDICKDGICKCGLDEILNPNQRISHPSFEASGSAETMKQT